MEDLPEIDEHARSVAASPEVTWRALVAVVGGSVRALPRPLGAAWRLEHRERRGDWAQPAPGSTVPGFVVAESDPPQRLVLRGGHRFSRYAVRFTITPTAAGGTVVRARTTAAFPGLLGSIYRVAVIGSGGHALVVRRMLARVAERAEHDRRRVS